MTEFTADWLALREAVDAASRSMRLTRAVAAALPRYRAIDILDLGAGTGANVRYLAGKLPLPQRWLLVDHDQGLLSRAPELFHSVIGRKIALDECAAWQPPAEYPCAMYRGARRVEHRGRADSLFPHFLPPRMRTWVERVNG